MILYHYYQRFRNLKVYFVKFEIVDSYGQSFHQQICADLLNPELSSDIPEGLSLKAAKNIIRAENIHRQETALKQLLEKLPDIIDKRVSDNLRQNKMLQMAVLG